MKHKKGWYAAGAVVLALIAGAFFVVRLYLGQAVACDAVVLIPTGSDYGRLADSLRSGGAIPDFRRFDLTARAMGLDRAVRPGRYALKEGMTYREVINRLKAGLQSPARVTFNNVRTLDRLAGSVSRRLELDSASLAGLLLADSTAARCGYAPQTFLAMFIPNTYELYWNCSSDEFLSRMQRENERFWQSRERKLARTGLNRIEAYTLASIVYEETKRTDEMPRVAGVYINRLKRGMPLQADPTVRFALGDFSIRRVLNKHLEVDSPYNTYRHPGLPPGPICMPSIAAIDAVLDYENHDYLYFCAKDDLSGSHAFARSLAEHNRNAQAYARALNRRGIR